MKESDSNGRRKVVLVCFLLYAVAFLFGGTLLTTPPAKVPLLIVMLVLVLIPCWLGKAKARGLAIALVAVTVFLVVREIVQGREYRAIQERTPRSLVETNRTE